VSCISEENTAECFGRDTDVPSARWNTAGLRARMGQIEDAERTAEFQDVLQQESDLTAGHGVLRYTGLIAVSARTEDKLEESVSAIEQAAVQASCETRRLVGQQAQAFAVAALPLCRVA